MNEVVTKVVYTAGGALVGAAVGFVVGELVVNAIYNDDRFETLAEALPETEETEEPTMLKKVGVISVNAAGVGTQLTAEAADIDYDKLREAYTTPPELTEQIAISEIQKKMIKDNLDPSLDIDIPTTRINHNVFQETEDIYPITEDQFINDQMEYDTGVLNYFTEDDVLADMDDAIILGNDVVGIPSTIEFDETDVAYIRNRKTQMIYEVVKIEESYSGSVLGIDDIGEDVPISSRRELAERKAKNNDSYEG